MTWWKDSWCAPHMGSPQKLLLKSLTPKKKKNLIFLDNSETAMLMLKSLQWTLRECQIKKKKKKSETPGFGRLFSHQRRQVWVPSGQQPCSACPSPQSISLWVAQGQAGSRLQRPQHCSYPGTRSPTACGQRSSLQPVSICSLSFWPSWIVFTAAISDFPESSSWPV